MSTPDLTNYLTELEMEHPEEIRRITESLPRDYFLTSLILKLEKRWKFPVVILDRVEGSDYPVVGNLFADWDRLAGMIVTTRESFFRQWMEAESNPVKPVEVEESFWCQSSFPRTSLGLSPPGGGEESTAGGSNHYRLPSGHLYGSQRPAGNRCYRAS